MNRTWADQDPRGILNAAEAVCLPTAFFLSHCRLLMKLRDEFPYLRQFIANWGARCILQQLFNNRRGYLKNKHKPESCYYRRRAKNTKIGAMEAAEHDGREWREDGPGEGMIDDQGSKLSNLQLKVSPHLQGCS
jgi:hypothetical protein